MFKVGDLIEGTERGNGMYSTTNEAMLKAEVVEVLSNGKVEIIIISHLDSEEEGEIYTVEPRYFDLVSSSSTGTTAVPQGQDVPKPKNEYETLLVLGLL